MSCPEGLNQLASVLEGLLPVTKQACSNLAPYKSCSSLVSSYLPNEIACHELFQLKNASSLCDLTIGALYEFICEQDDGNNEGSDSLPAGPVHYENNALLAIPFILSTVFLCVAFLHNFAQRTDSRFQALSLVILSWLWFIIATSFLQITFPRASPFLMIINSLIEGYVAYTFGGMMVSYAEDLGSVIEALETEPEKRLRSFLILKVCKKFRNGMHALRYYRRGIIQLLWVKGCVSTYKMSVMYVNKSTSSSSSLELLLGIVLAVSLFVMLRSLANLWQPLYAHGLLVHSKIIFKFSVIKLFYAALAAEMVILGPLINAGVIAIPEWMCTLENGADISDADCADVFNQFVFMCCGCVTLFLALFAFAPGSTRTRSDKSSYAKWYVSTFVKDFFRSFDARRLWRQAEQHHPVKIIEDSSSPTVRFFKACFWGIGVLACLASFAGFTSPVWLVSTIDGCNIALGYTGTYCHGSCPTSNPDILQSLASSEEMQSAIVYGICHTSSDPPLWSILGLLCLILSFFSTLWGVMRKRAVQLVFSIVLGVVSVILMKVYGTESWNADQAVQTLQISYGLSSITIGGSMAAFIASLVFSLIASVWVYLYNREQRKVRIEVIRSSHGPQSSAFATDSDASREKDDQTQASTEIFVA